MNVASESTYVVDGGCSIALLGATGRRLAVRSLGPGVVDVAVDRSAGLVYVSHLTQRRIHVLHADDLRPLASLGDPSFIGPCGLAVDPGLRRVYVVRTHRSGGPRLDALTVIQRHATGRHSLDRTVPLRGGVRPGHVAVDATAGFVFVAGRGAGATPPTLVVLDRSTLDELGRARIDGRPTGLRAADGVAVVEIGPRRQTLDGASVALASQPPSSAAGS